MHIEQLVTMANDIANFFRNGSDPGAATSRSVKAAINACFSARRCNCQTARPTNSKTIANVTRPNPAKLRRRPAAAVILARAP